MAEVVGALYAVETAVEGAAAGALAVSGSTVPLHAKFQKVLSPSPELYISGGNSHIIKSKIYLIGGHNAASESKDGVQVLSFRPDFGSLTTDATQAVEVDFEFQQPEVEVSRRPLEPEIEHLEKNPTTVKDKSRHASLARNKHGSATVEDRIFILGGMNSNNFEKRTSNTSNIIPLDNILAVNILGNKIHTIAANPTQSTEGIPEQRYLPSCTSSNYPLPISTEAGDGPSLDAHGTIFLHGGYNVSGEALHDTWTFDIGTRAWHKFPTIVEESLSDASRPGQIVYIEHRLWYINGSTVMYLDLAERYPDRNDAASQNPNSLSTGRVGSGQWQVVYPPPEDDPAAPAETQSKEQQVTRQEGTHTPSGPTAHVIPVTTGAGRVYLLSIGPENPQSIHVFQIQSTPKTATALKDTIRDKATEAISNLPESWRSGKFEWSKAEVVQATMHEGEVEKPDAELTEFAVSGWDEYGDKIVLWGGRTNEGGVKNEGWIVSFD